MTVAWIGNREVSVERAVEEAAVLLEASRCPVFTLDTDVHATRAAIALADLVGAAYDHARGAELARETALLTDSGGMFVVPGEVRRRGDAIIVVGALPDHALPLLRDLAETAPDLSSDAPRPFFVIGTEAEAPLPAGRSPAARISTGNGGVAETLAALRTRASGRKVAGDVEGYDAYAEAIAGARFPVFVFSGRGCDALAMEMLQGLIDDLNHKARASSLHVPASESGWSGALTSTWTAGFPSRASFARGMPEYDPWLFDVDRMLAAGEADLHLWIAGRAGGRPPTQPGIGLIALAPTSEPIKEAAVTIAVGVPGLDHDAVTYTLRTGTIASRAASASSQALSAASVLRGIADVVTARVLAPC